MPEQQTYLIQGTHFEISRVPDESPVTFVRIGDPVRVLKKTYDGKYTSFPGVVASFDNFKDLPTFNIVYVEITWNECKVLSFAYNESTTDFKVAFMPSGSKDLDVDKDAIMKQFEGAIEAKKRELADLYYKMAYFEKNFGKFFSGI